MKEKIKLPSFLLEHIPWENHVNPIWPATTFLLHRNLNKFYFPSKMNIEEQIQTLTLTKELILKNSELYHPQFLSAEQLEPLDKEFLFEHFLCMENFQNTSEGQGFVIDESSKFLALLNIDDHLQLQYVDCKGDWDSAWNKLSNIETTLASSLDYAFSSRFGYLTSNLNVCGTGLEIYTYLHLPMLIRTNQLEEILLKQKDEDVIAIGLQGTLEEFTGDFLILHNRFSIGCSEEAILRTTYATAMRLMATEKILRTQTQNDNSSQMKDLISRAYGLLVHSFQLQTKEALDALSLIKLGVDLNWISGIEDAKINKLFFKIRRAHLLHANNTRSESREQLLHTRATYLHQELRDIKFLYS